jgi:hypothetical protein
VTVNTLLEKPAVTAINTRRSRGSTAGPERPRPRPFLGETNFVSDFCFNHGNAITDEFKWESMNNLFFQNWVTASITPAPSARVSIARALDHSIALFRVSPVLHLGDGSGFAVLRDGQIPVIG